MFGAHVWARALPKPVQYGITRWGPPGLRYGPLLAHGRDPFRADVQNKFWKLEPILFFSKTGSEKCMKTKTGIENYSRQSGSVCAQEILTYEVEKGQPQEMSTKFQEKTCSGCTSRRVILASVNSRNSGLFFFSKIVSQTIFGNRKSEGKNAGNRNSGAPLQVDLEDMTYLVASNRWRWRRSCSDKNPPWHSQDL